VILKFDALKNWQAFLDFIENETNLYQIDFLGYPWYQAAIEVANNNQYPLMPLQTSSEIKEKREKDFQKKVSLFNSKYEHIFLLRAHQRRRDKEQYENYLFHDLFLYLQKKGKRFLIFEMLSNSDAYDAKYLKSQFADVTIPFEYLHDISDSYYKEEISQRKKDFNNIIENVFSKCSYTESFYADCITLLKETYLRLSNNIPNIVLLQKLFKILGIKAFWGGMMTELLSGLNNEWSVVEVEHGSGVKAVRRSNVVLQYYKTHLNLENYYALTMSDSKYHHRCLENNVFYYGIPEIRYNRISSDKKKEFIEKYTIKDQKVFLIATSGSSVESDLVNLIRYLQNKVSNSFFLIRQHPFFDSPLDISSLRNTIFVNDDNLFLLFSIADIIISSPSSIIEQASIFTDKIIIYRKNAPTFSDELFAQRYPWTKFVDLSKTEKAYQIITDLLSKPQQKMINPPDDVTHELERLLNRIEESTQKQRHIKVTFLAYGPNQMNGPNIWLQRVLPELSKRGFQPQVLFLMSSDKPCEVVNNLRKNGIRCITILRQQYTEQNILQILNALKADPPDIFIPNLSVPAYFASRWIKETGIPTVGILHSDDTFHHELIDYFVSGSPEYRISGIVCVSKFIEELVRRAKDDAGIEILRCSYGIDIPKRISKNPADKLNLVYTGRLIQRQKRIFDVINSLKNAVSEIPDTYATIYGEDREGGKVIETIKNLNLGERLQYGGLLKVEEIFPALLENHVFVLLSDYEGMSISLMEAMACGLVPICTKTRSGATEIIKHDENGLLVDNREDGFINAVKRLKYEKGLWARLSKAARETIEKEYTIEICADRWAEFLTKLAKQAAVKKIIHIPDINEINLPPSKVSDNGICREDKRMHGTAVINNSDNFLNPLLTKENMDLYIVRSSILHALKEFLPQCKGVFLDIGCGEMPYKSLIFPHVEKYIGLDIENHKYQKNIKPDIFWNGRHIPLDDNSVDCAMATELFEHVTDIESVLNEIKRVLKPGGSLFFTVPFLWPLHDNPQDEYRYTPFSLKRHLQNAGFSDVKIEAMGGWDASLAQMMGLWVRRNPMTDEERNALVKTIFPFYQYLLERESSRGKLIYDDMHQKSTMITGLSGTALKQDKSYREIKTLLDQNRYEDAFAKLDVFVKENPSHALANNDLGTLYNHAGDKDKALQYVKRAVDLEPDNSAYKKNLGTLYFHAGNIKESFNIFKELFIKCPDDIEVIIGMGGICQKFNMKDDARQFYRRALKLDPGNAVVRENLANKYKSTAFSKGKVVVITDQFPVLSQTFIMEQITGLIDRGFNVENWTLQIIKDSVIHPKVNEYNLVKTACLIRLPADNMQAYPEKWVEEFKRINNISGFQDIMAFHIHFGPNFNRFGQLFKIISNFVVVSFHGYDGSATIQIKGKDVYKYLFERVNVITTPSHYMRDELIRNGCTPEKIRVHRYGVDINRFTRAAETNKESTVLLTVARFVEKKGLEYAIKAFALLPSNIKATYRLVGDGPLYEIMQDLVKDLNIQDRVLFLGAQPQDVVLKEMANADIFVLTSVTVENGDKEGVPVCLIEAQAMELPVISTKHAGIPELIIDGKSGFLADEKDVDQIGLHMQTLVNNGAMRRRFGKSGREQVINEFNIDVLNDTLAGFLFKRVEAGFKKPWNGKGVVCPICLSSYDEFMPFGLKPRPNALCPDCKGVERHRLLWLYLQRKTNFFTDKLKILDIAPTKGLSEKIKALPNINYMSIDMNSNLAMRHMDITAMDFPDNTFDCVTCYHVLEHIPDDRKAMREILRVMKPGGWAILQVPIKEKLDATLEGSHIADPAERKRLFGQEDHVRYYGLDYKDRLEETGFTVKVDDFVRSLSPDEIETYALTSNENIYFCMKEGESVNAIKTGFCKDVVKVVFAVTETGEMSVAGDYFTALELGLALKDKLGWDVEWLPMQKWYDVEGADILIAMTDHYDIKRLGKLSLELVKICWMRNWFDRWAVKSYFQNWDIYLCSSLKAQIHFKEKYGIDAKLFRIANNHKRFYQTTDFQDKTLDYCFTSNYWNADRDIEKIDPEKIGYSFALFGKNWEKHPRFKEYYKGFVPYAKLPEIYNQTKILVDDANHVTKEWGSVNSRVFDAIASGTLVISNSAEASRDVFNGMLDVYKDVEDLKLLMDKYINNKDEYKEKIGLLRNIVLSGHTYNIRAEEFMGILSEYLPNIKYGRKKILADSISSLISDKKIVRPEVSIIIPVFNQAEYTKKCMESIVMNTPGELYEVVIIDNGSTDETKELLKCLAGDVKIITNKVNMGFAKACNQGAKVASGKYLLFLNNDTQVQQHWLQPLVNTVENNLEIGAVGSKLLYPDGKVQHAGVIIIEQKNKVSLLPRHVFMGDYPSDVPIEYPMFFQAVTAACLLIKKNIFDSVDGFNEAYWNGSEDVDLCFKIRQAGYKIAYEPKSVVIHHESKSGRERIAAQPRNNLLLRQRWSKIIKPDIHEDERGYLKAVSQTIELYNTNAISKEEYFKHMLQWWVRYSSCSVSSSTKSDKIGNSNIFNNADISIIIPIYNAFEETKTCVGSVIENTPDKIQIILLDDGSTDERIWPLLDKLQQRYPQITAIRHETNQGYTKTINHGCRLAGGDVILLNSDTQVTPGWLQKLHSAAYSKDNVATVTPLSNAAGAFSIPYNNQNNTLPEGIDINRFAELVEKYSLKIRPMVPTGNGFCLYIKKKAFERVGYFDDMYFPLGYGEENDFCMRCTYSGMVHLIEDSTFVYHKRSASFKERREAIFSESWQKLLKRHPSYNAAIEKWLANDPLDAFRTRLITILEKEVISNENSYSQRFKMQVCNVDKRPAKKVLFINHSLPPYEYSGTPISTLNHALGMKERGIEVAVMIPSLEVNEGFKQSVEHGLKLYKVPYINKYQAFFKNIPEVQLNTYLSGMNKIIHLIAPDIIHINDCVSMPIEIIGLFHNSGIPVVRNVCNDEEICLLDSPVYLEGLTAKLCEGPNSFDKCARCFYKNVLRKGADEKQYELVRQKLKHNFSCINAIYSNFVDGVVFTHELFKEHFTKFVFINPEKIRIIPRGFDFDFERNTSIREIHDNVVNFAFLGNLVHRKGIDVLLRAFEEIADYDGFRLYIFGATEGSFDACIESLQKKYSGKIIYCGHFEKDALPGITRKININISPSYFETYNRVVRESLYLGMPVIATDFYGSSIVEHGVNGIKIPVGDFKALANAMINLINNHQLVAKLSKGAIETNIPKLEGEIDGLLNFYDELIGEKQNKYLHNAALLDKKGEVTIEPFRMAEALFQKGAYNEAIDAYKKAIETSPSYNQQLPPEETSRLYDAYYNLALSYVNTQNLDDAIATFQKAVELHNADATIYNNLGVLYFKKKLHDDARHCFEKALAIDVDYAEAQQNLEKISSLKIS